MISNNALHNFIKLLIERNDIITLHNVYKYCLKSGCKITKTQTCILIRINETFNKELLTQLENLKNEYYNNLKLEQVEDDEDY